MTQEKAKKRGRPAQLLEMAELHAFVEFLLEKDQRSELQNQVIDALRKQDFNFEMLSEAQQILVKEALKPYREHTKLVLLAKKLQDQKSTSTFERKFLELYSAYDKKQLGLDDTKILKMMCTRYMKFMAQKLEYKDLELYLSQIEKKDAGKKRKAENQRKFEVGSAVLSIYKVTNDDKLDTEKFLKKIRSNRYITSKIFQTKIFKKVWGMDLTPREKTELFFEVLNQLTLYSDKNETIKFVDFAIKAAHIKIKQKTDSVAE